MSVEATNVERCPHCLGRGELVPAVRCLSCAGSGRVCNLCREAMGQCDCPAEPREWCPACLRLLENCECL